MSRPKEEETLSRRTPLNDAYPTCERTCAKLLIYPGAMHPSKVTELLRMNPTRQVVAGESGPPNSLGLRQVGKISGWFLSSEGNVKSKDLRHHLDWLIAKLQPNSMALQELQRSRGVEMAVKCVWWSRYGDGGPTLWPEQMQALASLNLECAFEVSYYGSEGNLEAETE